MSASAMAASLGRNLKGGAARIAGNLRNSLTHLTSSSLWHPFLYIIIIFAIIFTAYSAASLRKMGVLFCVGRQGTKGGTQGEMIRDLIMSDDAENLSVFKVNHENRIFIPRIDIGMFYTNGAVETAVRLATADRPMLGIVMDGMPLGNPWIDGQAKANIRALHPLFQSHFFVIIRREDGAEGAGKIREFADLAGRRVFLNMQGTAAHRIARMTLNFYGIDVVEAGKDKRDCDVLIEMARSPRAGDIDAAIIMANPIVSATPAGEETPEERCARDVVSFVAESDRFDLVPIERVGPLHKMLPFLEEVKIVRASYPGRHKFPSRDVSTVGTDTILACTASLPHGVVFQITQWLSRNQVRLDDAFGPARAIDPKSPQATFSYILHSGAKAAFLNVPDPSWLPLFSFATILVNVCVAYCVYLNTVAIKIRADRMIRLLQRRDWLEGLPKDPRSEGVYDEAAMRDYRAALDRLETEVDEEEEEAHHLYKIGQINKDGLDRVLLYLAEIRESLTKAKEGAPPVAEEAMA